MGSRTCRHTKGDARSPLSSAAQGGDVFRIRTLYQGQLRAVYGGQIMAQALMAASQTVDDPDMLIFSLHCYFLVPSQAHSGLLYHVERTKDGRLFVARAVRVTQGKGGKVTCYCLVSFKKQEVDPIHMPHVSSELSGGPPSSFDSVERKGIWFNKSNSSGLPYEGFFFFPNNVQKKLLDREPIEPRLAEAGGLRHHKDCIFPPHLSLQDLCLVEDHWLNSYGPAPEHTSSTASLPLRCPHDHTHTLQIPSIQTGHDDFTGPQYLVPQPCSG